MTQIKVEARLNQIALEGARLFKARDVLDKQLDNLNKEREQLQEVCSHKRQDGTMATENSNMCWICGKVEP